MTALYPFSALLAPCDRSVRTGAERLETAKSLSGRVAYLTVPSTTQLNSYIYDTTIGLDSYPLADRFTPGTARIFGALNYLMRNDR
jgi:hypothetical protein